MKRLISLVFIVMAVAIGTQAEDESGPDQNLTSDRLKLVEFANKLIESEPLQRVAKMKELGPDSSPKQYANHAQAALAAGEYCLKAAQNNRNPLCKQYANLAANYYNSLGKCLQAYAEFLKAGSKGDVSALKQLEEQSNTAKVEFDGFVKQLEQGGTSQAAQAPTPTTKDSAKEVPAMQEVEATGTGATEEEAFKQAVVDAVRQVVGALVSAENVVKNDRVIKDEVLTLSNGFVDKVLNRDKTKMDDGTWQVKLRCIVRKGQLYGKLQKANVPTVKFDGVSLFADVVSQLDHQKSSVEMIKNAMKKFSSSLVTATMLEEKPKILERDERSTTIEFDWAATVDVDGFFKNFAPALDAACSNAALAKAQKPTFIAVKESKEYGVAYRVLTWEDNFFFKNEVELDSLSAIPVAQNKSKKGTSWEVRFYEMDRRILEQLQARRRTFAKEMTVFAHFRDSAGSPLLKVSLTSLKFKTLKGESYHYQARAGAVVRDVTPWEIDFSFMPLIESDFERASRASYDFSGRPVHQAAKRTKVNSVEIPRGFWRNEEFVGASILKHRSTVSIPTGILSKISKVDLSVE